MSDEPLRVVIVDDHATYRRGLRAQFRTDPGIEVAAEVSNADDAVSTVLELQPSVTIMDLHMPRTNGERETYCGADAIRQIRGAWPEARIVVLTMHYDAERVQEALRAGAIGYLLKSDEDTDFVQEIRLAAAGKGVFDRHIVRLFPVLLATVSNEADIFPELTRREQTVLRMMADGLSNNDIAAKLDRARKTVDNMLPHILGKLHVTSRDDAISLARAKGLGGQDGDPGFPDNRDGEPPFPRDGGW